MNSEDFVGTWRLVGFHVTDADGNQTDPWLEGSDGMLIYTADGYMSASMAVVDKPDQETPDGMTYCGPYEVLEDRVIHHVVMSSEARLVGQGQTRMTDYDGKTLSLSSSPSLYGGDGTTATLLWQRAE